MINGATKAMPLKLLVEELPQYVSDESIESIAGHYPSGGSFKQLDHFRQIMLTGEFKMYDYDFENEKK